MSAATPSTVSQDFVKTILGIPGGSGNQITSFLRKVGLAGADGSPTELYKHFRNPDTTGKAAAEVLRTGYARLYARNEYMHKLPDDKLRGLIIEETGHGDNSTVTGCILACIKAVKKFASWSAENSTTAPENPPLPATIQSSGARDDGADGPPDHRNHLGLNLSYTINLNLPVSSDASVFNAIFKSLKENLLKGVDD